jgi:hypothetical protein
MNTIDFIRAIRAAVHRNAAKGIVEVLHGPSGRRPERRLVELSQWFRGLSQEDRDAVARVADLAADQATYNFLLVLDGLLPIEPAGPKGRLELIYDDGTTRTRLNGKDVGELSASFKKTE